jgi:hypothetical protein
MTKSFTSRFEDLVSVLFIVLFVYTAVSKLIDYDNFYRTMDVMPALKGRGFLIAPSIIISELLISGLLVFSVTRMMGLYLSLALMSVFTSYLLFAVMKGYALPCTCGGVLRQLTWKQHVFFNFGFIILAMSGIVVNFRQKYLLQ